MVLRWRVLTFLPRPRAHRYQEARTVLVGRTLQVYRPPDPQVAIQSSTRVVHCVQGIQRHWVASCEVTIGGIIFVIVADMRPRPQYVVLPKNEAGFSIDDQYYVGASGLLVKPITKAGVTETTVYIGEDQVGKQHVKQVMSWMSDSVLGLLRLLQWTCLPRLGQGQEHYSARASRTRSSFHSWRFHCSLSRTGTQVLSPNEA